MASCCWTVRSPLAVAALLLAGVACRTAPLPVYKSVGSFALTSQDGQPFRSDDRLRGHVWVADMIYTTCPGPCPRITTAFRKFQESLGPDENVRFVSLTVDPARDTPPVLSEYAHRFQADTRRWYFLTGPTDTLHQITRNAFLLGSVDGTLEHSTRYVLVDKQSRIRGYYEYEYPEQIAQLRKDIARLEKE